MGISQQTKPPALKDLVSRKLEKKRTTQMLYMKKSFLSDNERMNQSDGDIQAKADNYSASVSSNERPAKKCKSGKKRREWQKKSDLP